MSIAVENLGKLDRKVTLAFAKNDIEPEKQARLARMAKTVKMAGFRPGKVPLKVVEKQYGEQITFEAQFDKAYQLFLDAVAQQNLRVAGQPSLAPKTEENADQYVFEATFEVYPEITLGDFSALEITRTNAAIGDAEIDKTLDILRKQRVHYHVRGEAGAHGDGGADAAAQNGDRVTLDFSGAIDGVPFAGGQAAGFTFVLGEGRMLPEFEQATLGMKAGETKKFPLAFPEDYHGKDVAGKTAEFTITVQKVEWPHLPAIDAEFAKMLGVADGDLDKMRADIRGNLEREVKRRTRGLLRDQVLDAVLASVEFDAPNALIAQDQERLVEMARQDLAQRGMPNAKTMPIPAEMFKDQAQRRVKLGLLLAEIVKAHDLSAKADQIKAEIEDLAKSYENPNEVVRWYYSEPSRLAEIEAYVVESNVIAFVEGKAKVTDKSVSFDELTAAPQA